MSSSSSSSHHHHHRKGAVGLASLAGIAGIAGGAYRFGEFITKASRLHDVGSESAVFVRLVQNVQADLRETERLLHLQQVKSALRTAPEKVRWIGDSIRRVSSVMEEMGKFTARVEGDLDRGKHSWWGWIPFVGGGAHVGVRHRLRWVLDEYDKLVMRRMELAMAHQSLVAAMEFLSQFEPLGCCDGSGDGRKVDVDVERELFEERHGRGMEWEERDGDFVEKRRHVRVDERRNNDRNETDRAFVEGREDRIQMVDREKEDDGNPGYGYFGGIGPRRRSESSPPRPRRAYEFDEPQEGTAVYRKKTSFDYDVPGREVVRERRTYDYDSRDRGREADVVRRERIYRADGEDRDREVFRQRREYETDRRDIPLRTHSQFSSRL